MSCRTEREREDRVNILNRDCIAACFSGKTKIHCRNKQADNYSTCSKYLSPDEESFISISTLCSATESNFSNINYYRLVIFILKINRFQNIEISNYV